MAIDSNCLDVSVKACFTFRLVSLFYNIKFKASLNIKNSNLK